ncbi:hypothetical protein CHGG_09137 [Chaetomium globosum CBS 148.51]|uniref:DUF7820 domain-containing protein n=1 Tax=Chaetomium globosum (strain ATCC 6205 / CBS 148.51 / DSM 1962 / NBRC 6347 / NRRL 1970) TaxID=306901 RepID=Q2GSB7_CHAGB|nr:uncharacterized protein CHGG_09137 [Chaetomium globosum CBS 148.51]EAQ85123.1 hypothetical protein CHGG_09137 [Chaetomium globosum CBS 148.51]
MYPQNVRVARTLSMATSSTMPMSESSYRGPRGPSHPYGLYPQSDAIGPDATLTSAIPLGFRGLPDQYQRRVGPEGEEAADMIGPGGHTEQLPPYTRYQNDAYAHKAATANDPNGAVQGAVITSPVLTTPASTIPPIYGAGGIGLATTNPEFESTDDLDSPRSRHSTRSFTSDDSQRRIRVGDEDVSEKRKPPKKWQAWMRRKLCGIIPYWAICLTAIILVVLLVVLGAVVGTVVGNKQRRPPRKGGVWEPPYDATPIPPPPDLQPLPTGTFGLPLLTNRISSTCFQNPTLSQAWSCHLVISGMTLSVAKHERGYHASLDFNRSYTMMDGVYSYGEQPPMIEKSFELELVEDKFEPSRGPAWFKMVSYNKTVILPEGWLGSSGDDAEAQKRSRHAATIGAGISNFKRKGIAQPGDKPWVCSWPNTYLELFIYAQQNSSFSNWPKPLSVSMSSAPSTSSATPPPTSATAPVDGSGSSSESSSPSPSDPRTGGPNNLNMPYNNPPHNFPRSPPSSTPASMETEHTATESSTATSSGPYGPIDTGHGFPSLPAPYPRVIKLQERRISTEGTPRARCTQVEIQGPDQKARPVRGPGGKPVIVEIEETDPFMPPGPPGPDGIDDVSKRALQGWDQAVGVLGRDEPGGVGVPDISPCGCMWFLT